MNKLEDFNHSKIIKIEPRCHENGKWSFNLTYELWDDDGNKAELNIPCVESPFYDNIDVIKLHQDWKTEFEIRDGNNNLVHSGGYWTDYTADMKTLDRVDIYAVNDSDESLDYRYFYTVKTIKKKMTIDDIEKVLGYKVEIVDEQKGEFYDC